MAEALVPMGATLPQASEGRLLNGFGLGPSEAKAIAKRVVEDHRKGKAAAHKRMLTSQKYAYHVFGEGDAQWAEIVGGSQVRIPRKRKGSLRHQDNILRPMVDYWIAYFTTQPLRCIAEHRADQRSRDRARIDTIVANHHLHEQQITQLASAAMYMAAFNGWGILHSMWRNDVVQDGFETAGGYAVGDPAAAAPGAARRVVLPGFTDVFPGNPFDTVYAPSATRWAFPWFSYGRSLPVGLVQAAFPEAPGIRNLEGSDREPSTSWFQRMLRTWESLVGGINAHGHAALTGRGTEYNIGMVCREWLPGQLPEFPRGALVCVALNGTSDTGSQEGPLGEPILLHVGPLPGGVASGTKFYALNAGDDPNGKAYVADLDDDQVRLNQAITMYAEMMSQFAYPQLFMPQGTTLLQNQTFGDKVWEYVAQPGQQPPQYQYPGTGANFVALLNYIKDIRESAFRKGGWQASSRGEASGANEPAKRAQFLSGQDKMGFAPTAISFRGAAIEILRKNHALRRQYQTLPLLVDGLGTELGYMAEAYVHKEDMSAAPPNFSLVSGFGGVAEERLAQLQEMVVLRGGDGLPILPTKRFWQLHPDQGLRPNEPDADDARRRRAHAINLEIVRVTEDFMAAHPELAPQQVPAIAQQLSQLVFQKYPPTWTDGMALPLFVEALDSLVQDPTVPPLTRVVAEQRQRYMLEWQQQAAAASAPAVEPGADKKQVGGGAPASAGAPKQ